MVKVFAGTPDEFYMDGYLQKNLDKAVEIIRDDWDMVFGIDGPEGSGKSVLCQQCAAYVDPTFRGQDALDRTVFTPTSFKKAVYAAKKGQAIVYDEAYGGLNARGSMGPVNRMLNKMFTEIRDRNLFIFVVLPTFFDLDKTLAIWRTRAILHVYHDDNFKRGYFAFYNRETKKALYIEGKKYYSYARPRPNFVGRFTDHWILDKAAYKDKKHKDTEAYDEFRVALARAVRTLKQQIALGLMNPALGLQQTTIAQIMGVTQRTIHNYVNNYGKDEPQEEETGGVEV